MPVQIRRKPKSSKADTSRVVSALEAYPILAKDICAFWKWIGSATSPDDKRQRTMALEYQLQGACQVTRDGDLADERNFLLTILETK